MAFRNNINTSLVKVTKGGKKMSSIFGKIKAGASRTAFEADKLRRSKKAEGELAQLRKQIDTFQERLGEITYLNYIHNEPQGQDSVDYIEKLKELCFHP